MQPEQPSMLGLFGDLARDDRARVFVRLSTTAVVCLMAAGSGRIAGWGLGLLWARRNPAPSFDQIGLVLGAGLGVIAAAWVWRPLLRRRNIRVLDVAFAVVITAGAIVGALLLDDVARIMASRGSRTELGDAIWLAAGAMAAFPWISLIYTGTRGRAIRRLRPEHRVRCPRCRHALTGLREATCPECGSSFTLEDLFAQQGYERPMKPSAAPSPDDHDDDDPFDTRAPAETLRKYRTVRTDASSDATTSPSAGTPAGRD